MFNASNAWIALQTALNNLLGPLGMKTLDPSDWAYRGDYNNADDGDDPRTAHGFNYHQGPVRNLNAVIFFYKKKFRKCVLPLI